MGPFVRWAALAALVATGLNWDIQWHFTYLRDSVWIPPHLLVMVGVMAATLQGISLIGRWRQERAYLLCGIIASTLFFGALALDDLWHRLYGVDNSIWSPPHLLFIITLTTGVISMLLLYRRRLGVVTGAAAPWSRRLLHAAVLLVVLDGPYSPQTQGEAAATYLSRPGALVPAQAAYGAPLWLHPAYGAFVLAGMLTLLDRWLEDRTDRFLPVAGYTLLRTVTAALLAATGFTYAFPPVVWLLSALALWVLPAGSGWVRLLRIPVVLWTTGLLVTPLLRQWFALPPGFDSASSLTLVAALMGTAAGAAVRRWLAATHSQTQDRRTA